MPTFTVEDGTGLVNSNSYVAVADADDYLSIKPNSATWSDLGTTDKQHYLMWATRLLDQRALYEGNKAVPGSALRWPRNYAVDKDGEPVANNIVPSQIKAATIEIAYHLLSQAVDPSAPPTTTGAAAGIKRIQAAEVSIEYDDNVVGSQLPYAKLFPVGLNALLTPLGSFPGSGTSTVGRIRRV